MLTATFGAGYFIKTMALLFVWALDAMAYLLVAASYICFYAVSQLNLFATDSGSKIYTDITRRFYMILSIVMVFVFAYYLIMMIIDPEGNSMKTSSSLVKETIISIIAIVVLPTVFNYLTLFQTHVLQENTIGSIILGQNGMASENPGKGISMMVFSSFYHPQGSDYSTFMDESGKPKSDAVTECVSNGASQEICQEYYDGISAWASKPNNVSISDITNRKKLRHAIGDDGGMEYMWILSTACACFVAYFFISYAIDLGTRAVKLGFLQLISPVPVMLRIFPKAKKTYDTWFTETKKTYLEVFLRVAVIFFIVFLCQHVPEFINVIFSSNNGVTGSTTVKGFATVCLILGLLKFAKEAPDLFKTLFASDGGLFKGLDLKPGVKRRITENEYAMKGISTAAGIAGGVVGNAVMRYNQSMKAQHERNVATGGKYAPSRLKAVLAATTAVPRGVVSGGRSGFTNTPKEFSFKNITKSADSGLNAGQASLTKAENRYKQWGENIHEFQQDPEGTTRRYISETATHLDEKRKDTVRYLSGETAGGDITLQTINQATSTISNYTKGPEEGTAEKLKAAYADLEKKLMKGETVTYGGKQYSYAGTGQDDSAKDLKKIFDDQRNKAIADKINTDYKDVAASQMATLRKQMQKEIGNLGEKNIAELNNKIASAQLKDENGDLLNISTIDQFLARMSDKNAIKTAADIELLGSIKTQLTTQGNNIIVTNQQKKDDKGDNK